MIPMILRVLFWLSLGHAINSTIGRFSRRRD
jgi:hypothetical protein